MTLPSLFAQQLPVDVVDEPGPDELDLLLTQHLGTPEGIALHLLLAHDHIAHLEAAVEMQREYMTGRAEAETAAAWAEAERNALREQLAAERGHALDAAALAVENDKLTAENAELKRLLLDTEAARDLAVSDLRSVLGVVELGLDASELAA